MSKKKKKRKKHHKKHKFVHKIPESRKEGFEKSEKPEKKAKQKEKVFENQKKESKNLNYEVPKYLKKDIRFIFILTAMLLIVMTGLFYLVNKFHLFDPLFKWLRLG